jgi:putative membrane protein
MKTSISLSLTILACAGLAACASPRPTAMMGGPAAVPATPAVVANSRTPVAVAPVTVLGTAEQSFIAVAAGSGMYEVEAARLAASRAADPQVRSYAQMLVDHHTANNSELMALVSTKGHRVAPGLPAALQQKLAMLQGLSGPAFDRAFVLNTGVQDHLSAIGEFERRRGTLVDRDVLAYLDRTLPALQAHLQQARDLAGRMAG